MAWFEFLKSEGFFGPDKNPDPIQEGNAFQIPYWDALPYLEKLSLQIKNGRELELTGDLVDIIRKVSERPKDNYRTWYVFIKILTNLPNKDVPIDILHFIPTWLSGRFDTMLQTSELCESLLPKFLNEEPSKEDIEKAEVILHYIFQIKRPKKDLQEKRDDEGNSYQSRMYLYFLREKFKKGDLIPRVAKYCSSDFILELARSIKLLLLDYPNGIQSAVTDPDGEYLIKIVVDDTDLIVFSSLVNGTNAWSSSVINYEDLTEDELKEKFVSVLTSHGIRYVESNDWSDSFQRLKFSLTTDLFSTYSTRSISELEEKYSHDQNAVYVFSLILRDLLIEKIRIDSNKAISILETLCFSKEYRIPFFIRMTLYVIGENWTTTSLLFWQLIQDDDRLHLFSNYKFQKELFEVLENSQNFLTEEEKSRIERIIDIGNQEKDVDETTEARENYWRLKWYAALKSISPFKERYKQLLTLLNVSEDQFGSSNETGWRSASVSPLSKEELLQKSNAEVVTFIKEFRPVDRWAEPNIDGLGDALGSAVEEDPMRFSNEIALYLDIGYVYSYRMLNAFSEAWRKRKPFDWENVLRYSLEIINNEKFYSGELKTENDSWNANADWVVGSIARLLTDGLQNDDNAFDLKFLPLTKQILTILLSNLEFENDFENTNMDFPTYSLNSTSGKVLRAMIDYSLRRARNLIDKNEKEKWEPEMKLFFERTLEEGIIDGHILEGMYFSQFYYLDRDWITQQVKDHYETDESKWTAFMAGILFSNPSLNQELYLLFYPHFDKAIDTSVKLKNHHGNGLVRFITSFYFWGYETISSQKLLLKFLNTAPQSEIQELIRFIWQQRDYPKSLTPDKQLEFQKILIDLWRYLSEKYENSQVEDEVKTLATLAYWIVFVPVLDETYTNLILKSSGSVDKTYSTHELLESLISLKSKGSPSSTSHFIGRIISSLKFREYIAEFDQTSIMELVIFMFVNGQQQAASEFCNSMASNHQMYFLRDVYEEYSQRIK